MKLTDFFGLSKQADPNKPPIYGATVFGTMVIVIFFGGFFLWSYLAPLETAAVAPGKVVVDTSRKSIQHLEGGIVKTLHVREGSKVNAGEPLITLDDVQAKARLEILKAQALELLATEARLVAERDGANAITWPERVLQEKENPQVKKIIASQEGLFQANSKTLQGQLEILQQQISQLNKQIEALQAQVESETKQSNLINEEIVAVEYLEQRKLIEKPRLLALKRESARLLGNRGEHLGLIARAQQQIGETQQKIITLKDDTLKKIIDKLTETQSKLADVLERETAARDVLNRTQIVAPLSGTVVGLKVHTLGGVITPGTTLMDIVPSQDKLVVEADVSPLDIDMVHEGLTAKVRLTAFKQRNTPTLDGQVTLVSPDSFTDEKTGKTYFLTRISISPEQLSKYSHLMLYPGMPVQVMIITDKRSAFSYFIQPFKDSFTKAFREQ